MSTVSANDLFDWNDDKKLALKVAPKPRNRLEFYENENPTGRMTRYGLVLDIDNSSERYNLNFETITIKELMDVAEAKTTNVETYRCIIAMLERFAEDDILNHPAAYVTSSKKNNLAGTGQHDLGYGKGNYYHKVGAILLVEPHRAPTVHLFLEGQEFVFDESDWEPVKHSSHPGKKYQSRF